MSRVRVAVIDSGVNPAHPHVSGAVAGGIEIRSAGTGENYLDFLGHGTAVCGAILEVAPRCEILAVKVFHQSLNTTIDQLVRALEWSLDQGAGIINLSLGTANPAHRPLFDPLIARAAERGVAVVAAAMLDGMPSLPGAMDGVVAVKVDDTLAPDACRKQERIVFASGYARAIPGVPKERNLRGVSFAVARVSGLLARGFVAL